MSAQFISELHKLRTTRTATLILLAAVALTLLGVAIEGLSFTAHGLTHRDNQRTLLGAGSSAVFFATLAGLLIVTGEFRYGTIRPTLLFEPRRRVVLVAKTGAAAVLGVIFAAVSLGVSFGAGLAILAVRNVDVVLTVEQALAIAFGTIAATILGAALGVAVGTLIRNQVGAIVAVVGYAFLVDSILFAAVPSVGRYLPGKAGDALAGRGVQDLLTPAVGGAVLAGWALAFIAIATLRNEHSDV